MLNDCILRLKNRLLQGGVPRGIPIDQAIDYFEENFTNKNLSKAVGREKARASSEYYLRNNPYCTVDETNYVWHTEELGNLDSEIADQRIDDVKSGKSEVIPMEKVFEDAVIFDGDTDN